MGGKRLETLADMAPRTDTLADIGTDHGMLLTGLALAGKIRRGIGVEIAQGPFARAQAHIAGLGLADTIEMRLGDGLSPLSPGEATACAIAGMGGPTIVGILEDCPAVAEALDWMLLQPMTWEGRVRLYLQEKGWRICGEDLVEERGILYQIILAERGSMPSLSDAEAVFGPMLIGGRHPLLVELVRQRVQGLQDIVDGLGRSQTEESHAKKARLLAQIEDWEALL